MAAQLLTNVEHCHERQHSEAVRLYPGTICTKGADDMSDHDEWISYSHWGMFTLERKFSGQIDLAR